MGKKGGGNAECALKKWFWHGSMFSCNHRLQESFSVCILGIVSLRYGEQAQQIENTMHFGKNICVLGMCFDF